MSCNEWKETEIGKIPKHWKVCMLSNLVDIQNGYAFKSKLFSDNGNPVIKIKNVNGKVVDLNECQLYPYELCEKLEKFKLKSEDILIAMTGAGSVGRVSKFLDKDNKSYYLNQRVGKVMPKKDKLNNEFLFQILSTDKYEKILFDLANGSGQPNLSPTLIGLVKIPLPPLEEQEKIANILSCLDDKIELNNEMNKTLEEMAQSLFKRWFVDFEFPNEDGEPYKSSGGEMVDSELGMIPKGWEVKEIKDFGEVITGKTPSTKNKDNYGNKYPFITIPDMHNTMFINKAERYLSELGHNTQPKKLIPKNSIIVSCIATVGLVSINSVDSHTNQQINSVVPNSKMILPYLLFNLKNKKEFLNNLGSGGTTTKNVNKGQFESIKIIKPLNEVTDKFYNLIYSSLKMIEKNIEENDNLIKLRDTLLPKLMSGEISINSLINNYKG